MGLCIGIDTPHARHTRIILRRIVFDAVGFLVPVGNPTNEG